MKPQEKEKEVFEVIRSYGQKKHGNSDHFTCKDFLQGEKEGEYAPISYVINKSKSITSADELMKFGFVHSSLDLFTDKSFVAWYHDQYSKKIPSSQIKKTSIFYRPNNLEIFKKVETIHSCYQFFGENQILINGKKLPVQLGEWYAKNIFGLRQEKSTSQRGFDFFMDGDRVEVLVEWGDRPKPKGVKLKKSLVSLSKYVILILVNKNLMIREICFLDSNFILRKFSGKGHTIFLKESDIGQYLFSKSEKQKEKVKNKSALLKFASPVFAMKLT